MFTGSVCLCEDDTSEESTTVVEDDSDILKSFQDSHDQLVNSFYNLASNSTLADGESTKNTTDGATTSVDKKCFFFWPWVSWLLGCTERICFPRGAYSYIPVCGYDSSRGYRTFKNSCYMNATNRCYSTSKCWI